jgi:hypothetical protein
VVAVRISVSIGYRDPLALRRWNRDPEAEAPNPGTIRQLIPGGAAVRHDHATLAACT